MSYKLQYVSNLFLDLHKRNTFWKMVVPSSENLALLGNICRVGNLNSLKQYKLFLDYCSKLYKNVYIVPGPWEYCSTDTLPFKYDHCISNLYNLSKRYNNVTILNNSHVSIPNTNIELVGSTLWMRNPYLFHHKMFEYNYIWKDYKNGLDRINGEDMKCWHCEDLEYIRHATKGSKKYILLTHNLPHNLLVKDFQRKQMESSNLEKYMKKPIEIWLGGAGDHSVTGTFGYCRDIFCGTNPYTTFSTARIINTPYDPQAYISLRTDSPQLV